MSLPNTTSQVICRPSIARCTSLVRTAIEELRTSGFKQTHLFELKARAVGNNGLRTQPSYTYTRSTLDLSSQRARASRRPSQKDIQVHPILKYSSTPPRYLSQTLFLDIQPLPLPQQLRHTTLAILFTNIRKIRKATIQQPQVTGPPSSLTHDLQQSPCLLT